MAGGLVANHPEEAIALWQKHWPDAPRRGFAMNLRLLYADARAATAAAERTR